jgi:hypothetical protein
MKVECLSPLGVDAKPIHDTRERMHVSRAVGAVVCAGNLLLSRAIGSSHRYQRHRPESTALHPIVERHLSTLRGELQHHESSLPRFVVDEVDLIASTLRYHVHSSESKSFSRPSGITGSSS